MHNLKVFMVFLLSSVSSFANANNPTVPSFVDELVPNSSIVGEGRLRYWVWDVYDARLYAPNGEWSAQAPYALRLIYLRDLQGDEIAKRSIKEIRKQGLSDEVKLARWYTQMRNIFPNVTEGEEITGIYLDDRVTVFYDGKEEIGRVLDPQFGQYFFKIWLSEDTSAPELRRQLLALE